ncbi:hypothetical protein L7F22_069316 [Adiantum nelumboides]|nr:hypothetical protein [Adiantum nelumboides]
MQGGTGPGSFHDYFKSLQRNVNECFWPKISRAIATACSRFKQQQRQLENGELDHDVDQAQQKLLVASPWPTLGARVHGAPSTPPFSIYDVPCNDFNTLFALLYHSCVMNEAATVDAGRVPAAVKDPASTAWNENGTWILQGCKPETAMAYKEQFQDFTCFLRHRSQELVPGGLLFCVIIASTVDHDATSTTNLQARLDHNHLHTNLQAAWRQLVSEGLLLEQESLDAFNFPLFIPTIDEVKEVVCGDALVSSELEVVEMEYAEVERAPLHVWMEHAAPDAQTWGITCETMARNFVGSLILSHLGLPKFELLMERLRHVAAADGELLYRTNMMHVIVLAPITSAMRRYLQIVSLMCGWVVEGQWDKVDREEVLARVLVDLYELDDVKGLDDAGIECDIDMMQA